MSHFTVLVIGNDPEAQLQPFHEFECTGVSDQYVQNVNVTDEARAVYEKKTTQLIRLADGRVASRWAAEFYTKKAAEKWQNDEFELPAGAVEFSQPTRDTEPFSTWAASQYGCQMITQFETPDLENEQKYGWVRVDATGNVTEVIDRTNPNKRWDWYRLGGRWTGYFPLKRGARGLCGKAGLMTDPARAGYVDQARKDAIDWERLRDEKGEKARAEYQKVMAVVGDAPAPQSWESVLSQFAGESQKARDFYHSQEWIKRKNTDRDLFWCDAEDFQCTEAEYVQRGRDRAGVTLAVLKDGQWYEKGRMGWFGLMFDEKDQTEWNHRVSALLDELPGDTLLSVYDCHI